MSEVSDWIRLTTTPGIGCDAAEKLLRAFGLPDAIFSAKPADLKSLVSDKQVKALTAAPSAATRELIRRSEAWCTDPNHHLITLADQHYPPQLLTIHDPPVVLYAIGRTELLCRPSIAVVGSRNATTQGISNARQFAQYLSDCALTIISGLAQGIDSAAHSGGLSGNGSTIAVIGTGADLVYPTSNRTLSKQIASQGCLISEYPLGTAALPHNFPRRNRIISGLAEGVLVVEAAIRSGSLITAKVAADQGREVFAIPGSIHSALSKGCHQLIKQGAKLVECGQDVLDELRADLFGMRQRDPAMPQSGPNLPPEQRALLEQMGFDPIHPDALALRCHRSSHALMAQLVMLELAGQVEALPGGMFQRLIPIQN